MTREITLVLQFRALNSLVMSLDQGNWQIFFIQSLPIFSPIFMSCVLLLFFLVWICCGCFFCFFFKQSCFVFFYFVSVHHSFIKNHPRQWKQITWGSEVKVAIFLLWTISLHRYWEQIIQYLQRCMRWDDNVRHGSVVTVILVQLYTCKVLIVLWARVSIAKAIFSHWTYAIFSHRLAVFLWLLESGEKMLALLERQPKFN